MAACTAGADAGTSEPGRRLGARCPRRGEPGHGSWYLSIELPRGPGVNRCRIRRGGYRPRITYHGAVATALDRLPCYPQVLHHARL